MSPHHPVDVELVVTFTLEDLWFEGCPVDFCRRCVHSRETEVDDCGYHSGAVVIHRRGSRPPLLDARRREVLDQDLAPVEITMLRS